nr:MAG: nonstructural protein [Microvirus sp.]
MLVNIFTIFDEKARAYLPPFYQPEIAQAHRSFGDAVNDPETAFYKHPSDYTLFHIGSFDNETGKISYSEHSAVVANGAELKNRQTDYVDDEINGATPIQSGSKN